MTRLPRAEDRVIVYIDVDGEMVETEGVIQRITLHAGHGINMLTGQLVGTARANGQITITLNSGMQVVEPDAVDVLDGNGEVVQTIVLPPEVPREILP